MILTMILDCQLFRSLTQHHQEATVEEHWIHQNTLGVTETDTRGCHHDTRKHGASERWIQAHVL
jgi:carbamoylphosphate synthase small subunit